MIKFLLLLSMSFAPASDVELTFKSRGKITNKTVLSKLSKLALPQVVTVKDPNEGADIKFNAYPMQDVLNKVYGKDWENAEEILFTCADGYQPAVPVSVFKKGQAFLAFERIGSEFSLVHKFENKKKVSLAPLYLIWSGDIQASFWPYQLVGMDLVSFQERYPNVVVPENASAAAKRGFLVFKSTCIQCHSMNGQGSKIGPDLNYPMNVTEYYKEGFLKKWIDNPGNVRLNAQMPPLGEIKDRAKAIDDVVSYLHSMSKKKIKPQ